MIAGVMLDKSTKTSAVAISALAEPHFGAAVAAIVQGLDYFPGGQDVIKGYAKDLIGKSQRVLKRAGFDVGPKETADVGCGGDVVGDLDQVLPTDSRQQPVPLGSLTRGKSIVTKWR